MLKTTFVIEFDRFPEIAAKMPGQASAVVRTTAFRVEARAKTLVPVDTGTLKNSISTGIESGGLLAIVAPHTDYAAYVEFGTRRASARPYMIPAGETEFPAFVTAMKEMLRSL
jgi:HK97 gp10 family phage protein